MRNGTGSGAIGVVDDNVDGTCCTDIGVSSGVRGSNANSGDGDVCGRFLPAFIFASLTFTPAFFLFDTNVPFANRSLSNGIA